MQPANRAQGDTHLIFYATGLLLAIGAVWLFNRLVRLRNQVRNAWSDVDVQLQRRHDLVPMLVESVKGYAAHERQLLESIAIERSAAMRADTPAQRVAPETALGRHLERLIALGEAYPELKASVNFSQLSTQLVQVEDTLQHARRFYNGSVREYNTALETFPGLLVAAALAFRPAEFFAADADARVRVEVRLGESA
jgi:LemA protein